MARVDYYDDPNARAPNSIVVAVTAFVRDDAGRILMIRRTDNDLYAVPGGAQDLGESISQTVIRETQEEAGVLVEVIGLVGIYTNPNHVIAYSDGEVRQEFSICFRARPIGGTPRPSSESSEVHWIDPTDLNRLNIHPAMRLRITHGLQNRREPYIG
jgi:ADP-ribose pyrophosphatase YjhB (NUDIX family)